MKIYLPILWAICLTLLGCSDSNEPSTDGPKRDAIVLFISTSGVGDNGYNDMILNGTSAFAYSHDLDLYIIQNGSVNEAAERYRLLTEMYEEQEESRMIIVLASSEYEAIAPSLPQMGKQCSVLLLESSGRGMPEWMTTAKINRYGVSYLAGAMVSAQPAELIMAMPGETMTEEAATGFEAGFSAHSDGKQVTRHYLADDYMGFNMQVEARRLTTSIIESYKTSETGYGTFFPLAGGSNLGVYNAFTDYFHSQQAIGMDIDCNGQNDYIPFSIVFHMDDLIQHHLQLWYEEEASPHHAIYGLESDFVEMTFSESWDPMGIFAAWEEESFTKLPHDFWFTKYTRYLAEAINKEETYENQ